MKQTLAPYTVSQLNRQVRSWLEQDLGTIAVTGEMSTVSRPASGHLYFTLKDAQAQLRCVFFRNNHTRATALLASGQQVIATGALSLYEARGDYQLIVQSLMPSGLGELYQQFEQLKIKLEAQGLFRPERKKPVPAHAKSIAIVSSLSAAALQDILSTLKRRFPLADVFIYPSEVQGKNAALQLCRAIVQANRDLKAEVILLARGGGSMEDLWCFNDEALAMTISASAIPIVSGVGHETDFSIADFVADLRAATPTAAAEAVSPDREELLAYLLSLEQSLEYHIARAIKQQQLILSHYKSKISSPQQLVYRYWQKIDAIEQYLHQALRLALRQKHHQLQIACAKLQSKNPIALLDQQRLALGQLCQKIQHLLLYKMSQLELRFKQQLCTLEALSPLKTLNRGYSITSMQGTVLFDAKDVRVNDRIQIQLSAGKLFCLVQKIIEEESHV